MDAQSISSTGQATLLNTQIGNLFILLFID